MTDDAPATATAISALQAIRGPVAAVHTPFDEAGCLATEVIPAYAAHLRESGVGAVYVCGSTGESLALSVAERRAILEAWMSIAGEDLRVVAHVGSNALPDSLELARHADSLGVDGISAMNPTFGRAADVEALVGHHAQIADAGGGRPYLIYEISAFGGVAFPASEVVAASLGRVPGFAGLKFTSSDLIQLQLSLEMAAEHDLRIFFGSDEQLLAGLVLGCTSAIGSTYGYAPEPAQTVFAAFLRGDLDAARIAQRRIARLVVPLLRHGVLRTGRALLETVGVPIGPPRSPETRLETEALASVLEEIGPLGVPGLAPGPDTTEHRS
ncbi:MAG: dihydrodipicolinate synthase family protein [Phycisphaerales bacterium]|nr:dihydrodipicolinate synthase family protein [Phycisphaerales bacterium]